MEKTRQLRLYYEACIPVGLLVVGSYRHGFPPHNSDATKSLAASLPGALALAVAAVQLYMRLSWRRMSDGMGMLPGTQAAMYRPQADSGSVWGGLLVLLALFALNIDAGAAAGPSADGLGTYGAWVVGVAMAWAFTLAVLSAQIRSHNRPTLGVVGGAGVLSLGYAFASLGLAGGAMAGMLLVLGAAGVQHVATRVLLEMLPRSFTLGEAAAITQGAILAAIDLAIRLFRRGAEYPDHSWQMYTLVLESVGLGLLLLVCALPRVFSSSSRMNTRDSGSPVADMSRFCGLSGFAALGALGLIAFVSHANPVRWALVAVLGSRSSLLMLCYWVLLLLCGTLFYSRGISSQVANSQNKLVLHLKRKAYHILAVLLFAPGFAYTPLLLHLGFVVALVAFVGAEAVRALGIGPWAPAIDRFMRRFTDTRDAGQIVTSHFYLLFGCALPVWLGSSSSAACLAGVLSLGIADTAASLVGIHFGSRKWPSTPKTIEGTAAFVGGLFIAVEFVYLIAPSENGALGNMAMCVVLGLLEALTEQNDNLVIPLTMYSAATMLHHSDGSLVHWIPALVVAAVLAIPSLFIAR
ncbi:dolichol kinase [Coemansia sp. RSA 2611]|nr:dolichol kinase [Coemansia sp. RSA 2705]KAJ2322134.1 dolichol kinase [Coemansia sp. RSA 2704]KAJ2328963.1 dolichol kinase [Coemansia sp. RSA 2702]KAJ2367202.1 dolichol kinase [Coemansia sp. RSA 2610]KAJ2392415.1 dolichol kinase [Coemansia sp. RSA 2611]KAJ2738701.1 dolichol kinase [Coemansia sp. Cherry 401B]